MEVTKELILKVAKNARLKLTEEEVREFLPQFSEILKSFEQISKVNTDNIKPSFHPIEIKNALREDSPKECISQGEILKNTVHKKNGYFLGPRAL